MASSSTSRPASAASSASNKSGMKIKVPRPVRMLSNEQAIARQQQHAEIDQKFASGHTPRARKKPAWMLQQEIEESQSEQEQYGAASMSERDNTQSERDSEMEDGEAWSDAPGARGRSKAPATPLIEVLETLLHLAAKGPADCGPADCDTTMRALAAILLRLEPPLEEVLSAVTTVEARLVGQGSTRLATQCTWLSLLVEGCNPQGRLDQHGAEMQINAARTFLDIRPDNGPLACALVCTLLPQWAARLETGDGEWLQRLQNICRDLDEVQREAWRTQGRGVAAVAAVNAMASMLLMWAEVGAQPEAGAAAGAGVGVKEEEGEGEEGEVPGFVVRVLRALLRQLDELAIEIEPGHSLGEEEEEEESEEERTERDAIGLAAAAALGQLVRAFADGAAAYALGSPEVAQLLPAAAACVRCAAQGGPSAASAASGAVACLLGLCGDTLGATHTAWHALLDSAPAESAELARPPPSSPCPSATPALLRPAPPRPAARFTPPLHPFTPPLHPSTSPLHLTAPSAVPRS